MTKGEIVRLDWIACSLAPILVFLFLISIAPSAAAQEGDSEFSTDYETYKLVFERGGFELSLPDNGAMSRGWDSYTDTYTQSNPTTSVRRVLDHYETKKIYDTRRIFTGRYKKVYVGRKKVVDYYKTTYRTERYKAWVPPKTINLLFFSFTVPGHYEWRTRKVPNRVPVYKWVKEYKKEPIYRTERYVKRIERNPVYTRQRYTVYRNRKYRVTDYQAEDWGSKQIPITITEKNDYEGNVTVSVQAEDGINSSLTDTNLHIDSTASTTLTISPEREFHGSTHTITVTATDGTTTKTATYNLDLQTDKPSRKTEPIKSWTSGTRPNQTGTTTTQTNNLSDQTVPTQTTHEDIQKNPDFDIQIDYGDDRRTCDVMTTPDGAEFVQHYTFAGGGTRDDGDSWINPTTGESLAGSFGNIDSGDLSGSNQSDR